MPKRGYPRHHALTARLAQGNYQLRSFQRTWCDWLAQCSCPIFLLALLRDAMTLCLCKHNVSKAVHCRQKQLGNKAGHDSTYSASPANDNRTEPWVGLCLARSRSGRSDIRVGILGHSTHCPAALFSVLRRALLLKLRMGVYLLLQYQFNALFLHSTV